ncbi:hypothetical protein PSTG_20098, partial [Puccinia striiformis f. sp. tritici PST-78]
MAQEEAVSSDQNQSKAQKSSAKKPQSINAKSTRPVSNSSNQKPFQKANNWNVPDNIYIVYLPSHGEFGIKLDYKKPETFANTRERLIWEARALKEADKLKDRLMLGL